MGSDSIDLFLIKSYSQTPMIFAQALYITRDLGDTLLFIINQCLISRRDLRHQNGVLPRLNRLLMFISPNPKSWIFENIC